MAEKEVIWHGDEKMGRLPRAWGGLPPEEMQKHSTVHGGHNLQHFKCHDRSDLFVFKDHSNHFEYQCDALRARTAVWVLSMLWPEYLAVEARPAAH